MSRAVIGLDGLAPIDLQRSNYPGNYQQHRIDTPAHTAPSWNAILSGQTRDDLVEFWKIPDEYESGESIGEVATEQWAYDELFTEYYPWERDESIEAVSVPVCLPPYSTIWNEVPNQYGWPSSKHEFSNAISQLTRETLAHDDVITVFPVPDKMNHFYDNPDKEYSREEFDQHMSELASAVRRLTSSFDEWVIVSDHGKPSPKEWVREDLWIPSHNPRGLIASNSVGLKGVESNLDVYYGICELFGLGVKL